MSVREVALAAVDGLDLPAALQLFGGNLPMLERILQRFADRYRGGDPGLRGDMPPADASMLRSACHSLRGACAMIGASLLSSALRELELAAEAGGDAAWLADQGRRLDTELQALVADIEDALKAPAAPASAGPAGSPQPPDAL